VHAEQEETVVSLPEVVSRAEWLVARKELLAEEKELTRARDELSAKRRLLPMVEIDKEYVFEGPDGKVSLPELFGGRRQLMLVHVMFGPDWADACSSCSAGIEELSSGLYEHLASRDTTLVHVARAPIDKIEDYKRRKGWTLPWLSSYGSDFNYDFHVTLDESVAPLQYNYRTREEHQAAGTGYYLEGEQPIEEPGLSCFLREGDRVFHTYSQFARGAESTGGSYYFLDLTALGRQEDWEEPKDRAEQVRGAIPDFSE
jgi:predicted dithiol-disulfide oxidoreductase (DUF899 family)